MHVLAFDTTTTACSVSVCQNGTVLFHHTETMVRGQSEVLIPMILDGLHTAQVAFQQLERIAVTIGPGSFTGVRIGLAAARALGLAADIPVLGLTSTEVLAHAVPDMERKPVNQPSRNTVVAIDAKRSDVYIQVFDPDLNAIQKAAAVTPQDFAIGVGAAPNVLIGDGAELLFQHLAKENTILSSGAPQPDTRILAALATSLPIPNGPPRPLYIRPPDAIIPADGGRLRP